MRGGAAQWALLSALVLAGCKEPVAHRAPPRPDATPRSKPSQVPSLTPQFPRPSASQRAYDRVRRAALSQRLVELWRLHHTLRDLARRGAAEPAFRERWPAERDRYLQKVGRLRARVLAVDPLGTRSWAAQVATHLVGQLAVRLPDAVRESWDPRPSGALSTASADFTLIWQSLQRYVRSLDKEKTKGSSP